MPTRAKRPIRDWLAIAAAEIAMDRRQWLAAAVLATILLTAVLYFAVVHPEKHFVSTNWGFGPDWDCGDPVRASDLVCIKRPAPKPN